MTCRLLAVAYDAADPVRAADFWARLLGRDVLDDPHGPLLPGDAGQVGLRFVPSGVRRSGRDRLHLHLTSTSDDDQQATVAKALELGATHLDVGQLPEEGHVVLADPDGNELCVLPPGNAFLAGCGFLGEVGCDGAREVGLFWSGVLDWPLVWDRDGETAVQAPYGGSKVAWGGPPVAPKSGRNRQRFDLVTHGDLEAEVQRLVSLGATRLGTSPDGVVELADPDGNELWVSLADPAGPAWTSDADLRVAGPAHADDVGRLLHDFNVEFAAPTPSAAELGRRFRELLEREDVLVLLAGREPDWTGFAYLTLRPTPYHDGRLAQLEELYVAPSLRDGGIGTALLTEAVRIVRDRGAAEVHINVDEVDTDTRRFYERHGFVNIEPGTDYRMLCYLRELDD